MSKFLRKYALTIGGDGGSVVVDSGTDYMLRLTFDITHEWGGNRSMANIAIYGLSRKTEGKIFKEYDEIALSAGYESSSGIIFNGQIKNVVKERNGPDRITRIFALADRIQTDKAVISETAGKGSSVVDIIKRLGAAIGRPVIIDEDDFSGEPVYARGKPLAGDPMIILRDLSDAHYFSFTLEGGRIRVLKKGSALKNRPLIIGQDTGMIGSPEITEYGVNVAVNLNPGIRLGQKIEIDSRTPNVAISNVLYQNIETVVDVGLYTVQQITYSGDSHNDNWEAKLTGWRFG